jgi:hypothetical protein
MAQLYYRGPPRAWRHPLVLRDRARGLRAATDPAHAEVGVSTQRAGALERVAFALADLAARRGEITRSKPACSVCSTSST